MASRTTRDRSIDGVLDLQTLRAGWTGLIFLAVQSLGWVLAQEPIAKRVSEPVNVPTSQQKLLLEQTDQLIQSNEFGEALDNVDRLLDEAPGVMVDTGQPQAAGTLVAQLSMPLGKWLPWHLAGYAKSKPELLRAYRAKHDIAAAAALRRSVTLSDKPSIERASSRYSLSFASSPIRLGLADFYLDRGATIVARQMLETPLLSLRLSSQVRQDEGRGTLSWPTVWSRLSDPKKQAETLHVFLAEWSARNGAAVSLAGQESGVRIVDVVKRNLLASVVDSEPSEFESACVWGTQLASLLPDNEKAELLQVVQSARGWEGEYRKRILESREQDWSTFAGNSSRSKRLDLKIDLGGWNTWSLPLERMSGSGDRNPASRPPVGEQSTGLIPYHPAVYEGRVYVNELTRIMAYDLKTGRPWPEVQPSVPVFDSGMLPATFVPLGYAYVGVPRGTLTISNDQLFARMGPPVTGWYGKSPVSDGRSASFLIGLDLNRQGSMLPGFPIRLDGADETARGTIPEFDGAPLVEGNRLYSVICERDKVGIRRSVIALDRESGRVVWRSQTVGSGTVSGAEQASIISHQLLSIAGGRLFVCSNLGTVACLDLVTGETIWLLRYRRATPAIDASYSKPDRFRYRDLSPCLVVGTQVYCLPNDCPELFCLDAVTGDLIWASSEDATQSITQILGVAGNSLIVSGDRILWFDRQTGQPQAAFPSAATQGVANGLPQPRGIGRGLVTNDSVYWPTQYEIYVFDSSQKTTKLVESPRLLKTISLRERGGEGGNLVATDDWLLIATPSRLMAFKRP